VPDISALVNIVILILLAGFFSAAEIGLISLSRFHAQRLAGTPTPPGRALAWLLHHPAVMLGTVLICITTANYVAEEIAARWVIDHLGSNWLWLAIVILSFVVILFAEIVPVLYAAANPERVARFSALPVRIASIIFWLPALFISFIGNLLGGGHWHSRGEITVDELRTIIRMPSAEAPLEEEEKEMLHSIFEFSDTLAREIMVPRERIAAIAENASVQTAAVLAGRRRISRVLVYRGDLDHLLGIVFVKDLLLPLRAGQGDLPVTSLMRPYFTVPPTLRISELLTELRRRKQMLAVVADETGRTLGLVTMEDLLEEIVGDIFDEYDLATPAALRLSDGWVVDGRMSLEEVNDLIEAELPTGRYTTIAGLLLNRLGSVPREGEKVNVDGFSLTVVRMDEHRIARVRITHREPADDSEESEADNA
jgi:putative hemolysin